MITYFCMDTFTCVPSLLLERTLWSGNLTDQYAHPVTVSRGLTSRGAFQLVEKGRSESHVWKQTRRFTWTAFWASNCETPVSVVGKILQTTLYVRISSNVVSASRCQLFLLGTYLRVSVFEANYAFTCTSSLRFQYSFDRNHGLNHIRASRSGTLGCVLEEPEKTVQARHHLLQTG